MKTNALRLLDSLGTPYRLQSYEIDPDDLSAVSVAVKIGLPPEQVFKTLLVQGDRSGHCFAVVPGNAELDLKALSRLTGNRAMTLVSLKDVEPLTGYIRGAVTVFGARKAFPAYIDESIDLWDFISVSAGARGMQVLLAPVDYLRASGGCRAQIAKPLI